MPATTCSSDSHHPMSRNHSRLPTAPAAPAPAADTVVRPNGGAASPASRKQAMPNGIVTISRQAISPATRYASARSQPWITNQTTLRMRGSPSTPESRAARPSEFPAPAAGPRSPRPRCSCCPGSEAPGRTQRGPSRLLLDAVRRIPQPHRATIRRRGAAMNASRQARQLATNLAPFVADAVALPEPPDERWTKVLPLDDDMVAWGVIHELRHLQEIGALGDAGGVPVTSTTGTGEVQLEAALV